MLFIGWPGSTFFPFGGVIFLSPTTPGRCGSPGAAAVTAAATIREWVSSPVVHLYQQATTLCFQLRGSTSPPNAAMSLPEHPSPGDGLRDPPPPHLRRRRMIL